MIFIFFIQEQYYQKNMNFPNGFLIKGKKVFREKTKDTKKGDCFFS